MFTSPTTKHARGDVVASATRYGDTCTRSYGASTRVTLYDVREKLRPHPSPIRGKEPAALYDNVEDFLKELCVALSRVPDVSKLVAFYSDWLKKFFCLNLIGC